MGLSGGAIAGIVLGSIFGPIVLIFLIMVVMRLYIRKITAGSDNPKQISGKTVVITGKWYTTARHNQ